MRTYYRISDHNGIVDISRHDALSCVNGRGHGSLVVGCMARERASVSYKLCTGQILHVSVRGTV